MPELFLTLSAISDKEYESRKFTASLQNIDLEKKKGDDAWERIKAKAFGKFSQDPNDIVSLSGKSAQMAGFGIGYGLDYSSGDESEWWTK